MPPIIPTAQTWSRSWIPHAKAYGAPPDAPTTANERIPSCATKSRNDPPHLVALLDLLRQGRAPDLNHVLPGDAVDEVTGARERLDATARERICADARRALERMIEITETQR